jgi:branched-chain amino acid transport system permease protein
MLGGLYALIALGLVLVYKSTQVLNLAYGQILMILAYLLCSFSVSMGLPLALSLLLVFVISALLGLALERFTMRPLLGQPVFSLVIMTLILGLFFQGLVTVGWKDVDVVLSVMPRGGVIFWQIYIPYGYLCSFGVALLIFLLLSALFRYTRVGLAMRVVSEDHQISQSIGINVKRIFAISWAVSCVAAAISGLLLGSVSIVNAEMGSIGIAKALPVLLLGGMESIPGALLGGLIVGIAEILGGAYAGAEFRQIIPFALMLVILLIRPHGLFGQRIIERI